MKTSSTNNEALTMRGKQTSLPGFRSSLRPKQRPIGQLSLRELHDLRSRNCKILADPGASSSTYVERVVAEQAAIESRLIELDGMETINSRLTNIHIRGEGEMLVDPVQTPQTSRTIEAKRKVLSQFTVSNSASPTNVLSLQEAMELERAAHRQDMERQKRIMEKKQRQYMPLDGESLTRHEREARIWAFMSYKPTESDMEDDDNDTDEDDPALWFEDDQDDGRKGQDIVEPDAEDFSHIIRVDTSRLHYNTLYEPRNE